MEKPYVDWSVLKKWPQPTLTCQCGQVYNSYFKLVSNEDRTNFTGVAEKPCPSCGKECGHVVRAEHPPEDWTVEG
jgi:hypothetical protein